MGSQFAMPNLPPRPTWALPPSPAVGSVPAENTKSKGRESQDGDGDQDVAGLGERLGEMHLLRSREGEERPDSIKTLVERPRPRSANE